MARFSLIFSALVLVVTINACRNQCPENEVYSDSLFKCQKTCEFPDGQPCPRIRVPGCICAEGFLRNSDGICVRPWECPPVCGLNEEYKYGGDCEPSCTNKKPICSCAGHRLGCFCKEGYVRNCDGVCIRPCDCPIRLKPAPRITRRVPRSASACATVCATDNNCPDPCGDSPCPCHQYPYQSYPPYPPYYYPPYPGPPTTQVIYGPSSPPIIFAPSPNPTPAPSPAPSPPPPPRSRGSHSRRSHSHKHSSHSGKRYRKHKKHSHSHSH